MKALRFLTLLILPVILLISCTKDLNINDDWKEIMIVYGLLNPNDSVHYIKITKAFLGPGNALQYAQIADSSNFKNKLIVSLDEYNGQTLVNSMLLDTTMLYNKDSGLFYFPDQLVYVAHAQLNADHEYRINIRDTVSEVQVTSATNLVNNFNIKAPNSFSKANFVQGSLTTAEWTSAKYGRMYQLNIRFDYWEVNISDTSQRVKKSVKWLVFEDMKSRSLDGGEDMTAGFYGDGFFYTIKAKVPVDPAVYRIPDSVEYIFTVASEDLSNYIEVTDPSNTIVQEKPIYTNIENGIGIFSSRTDNTIFSPRKLRLSDRTYDSLVDGAVTGNLF
jgi:hypothetical protein